MFERALAYHQEKIRQNQAVLDTDGNLYSDHHRAAAREALAVHRDIVSELTRPVDGVRASKALGVLNALLIDDRYEVKHLGSLIREVGDADGLIECVAARTERAEALQVALTLLVEAAERPRLRHVKRGSTYDIVGEGVLQTERPLTDGAALVVYRDVVDGRWFFRPPGEMQDGRFVTVGSCPVEGEDDGYEVDLYFDDMDELRLKLPKDVIALALHHGALTLDWTQVEQEDAWGDYVVRSVVHVRDSERVASLGLRRS